MIIKKSEALCFDDVLLEPQYFDGNSRKKIDLSTEICGIKLKIPIIAANMPSVCDGIMAMTMAKLGGLGIVHRMQSIKEQADDVYRAKLAVGDLPVGAAIGIGSDSKARLDAVLESGADIICVDVAHGHQSLVKNLLSKLPHKDVPCIVGNIATKEAALTINELAEFSLKVGVGGGCFAAGTRILMANGTYKSIEEIQFGDRVINKYGNPVFVKGKQLTGFRKVISYKNNIFNKDTVCTADHRHWVGDLSSCSKSTIRSRGYKRLLEVKNRNKTSKFKWKKIQNSQNDCLLMPRHINFELQDSFKISLHKRCGGNWRTGYQYKEDVVLNPSYELGYIFGLFLGDGTAKISEYKNSKRGSVHWCLGRHENNFAQKLNNCIKTIFNKELKIVTTKNMIKCNFYYKPFADFLFSFGEKENKHLPPNLLINNKNYLQGLFDGLIDSDGTTNDPRKSFCNTSSILIENMNVVHYLLFGYFPNNEKRKSTIGGLKNASVEKVKQNFVSRSLLKPDYRLIDYNQIVKITSFNKKSNLEIPVYDIEVDCPTHSFIANNAIVHNSVCTTRIQTGCGVPTLQSVIDVAEGNRWIIADGGIKNSGDIVKSLAAGADAVMLGSLLAGTDEAPGEVIKGSRGGKYKIYRGAASYGAKKEFFSKAEYVEGEETLVPYKGSVEKIIKKLCEGIRSGFSYCGSHNLKELQNKATFIRISSSGMKESKPHGLL